MDTRMAPGLEGLGIRNVRTVYWNLPAPALYEHVVSRREGLVCHRGPLLVRTGSHTGRAPNDKFIVKEPTSEEKIWWGDTNRPFDQKRFEHLYQRLLAYLQGREIFVQQVYACASPKYRFPIRVITESAWHSLFARNMFIADTRGEVSPDFAPGFTVVCVPRFFAVPEVDGTNSDAFIVVNFARKTVIIGGTAYGGEIKKSVFTVLNFLLPLEQVLPMHCSSNMGEDGDVAIFFGLSGTGKTSLSIEPARRLIGDDEHGWSEEGVFNFEGGCYAKVIRLSRTEEPEIYQATERFGTILENVALDIRTRMVDLDDDTLTENTRASFPIKFMPNAVEEGMGPHPKTMIMLTCDAFGILPPIAKLTPAQAMHHFLSGYTAKVAGTEDGVVEPEATFSTCFGAPFLPLHPTVYAKLLGEKVSRHKVSCWLVNTGWTGGPFGKGERINIALTRAMVTEAVTGRLDSAEMDRDPVFGLLVPRTMPGLDPGILKPRNTWKDKRAYDERSGELARRFRDNFRQFAGNVDREVLDAGPGSGAIT